VLWLTRRVVAAADTLMKIAKELQMMRIADDEDCRLSANVLFTTSAASCNH
jgi:hypothetical protein